MENDQELIEGFNAGYIIEKHRPELAKQLVEGLDRVEVPFVEGFIAGSKECVLEREQIKSRTISKLKSYGKGNIPKPTPRRNKNSKDKNFDIER